MKNVAEDMGVVRERQAARVVWLAPTMINDERLQTDEKKQFMTEEKVVKYREVQKQIVSPDLFLDLTKISKDRMNDSVDGIHYPDGVYDVIGQILTNSFDWLLTEKVRMEGEKGRVRVRGFDEARSENNNLKFETNKTEN